MREPSSADAKPSEERAASRNLRELGFLWRFVRPYPVQAFGALLALSIAALTVLGFGFGLRKLVDEGFSAGNADLFLRQLLLTGGQIAVQDLRFTPDLIKLFLELRHQAIKIEPCLLERPRLADLGENQQQDDRPETAADTVEKRQAEPLGLSPPSSPHGQSSGGLRNDPPLRMASFQ